MQIELSEGEARFLTALVEEHMKSPAASRVPPAWFEMWKGVLKKLKEA